MPPRSLRSPDGKPRLIAPVQPNAGLAAAYRKQLDRMIDEMQRSLAHWIKAAWRARTPATVAQDESPAMSINLEIGRLSREWQAKFNDRSRKMAGDFTAKAKRNADDAFSAGLRREGFAVEFQMTPAMRDAYQAVAAENVGLIRSIASEHLADVQGMVMRSVAAGGDLGTITKGLQARYGITKRRAALIASDQNRKATAVMTAVRQQELGITEAVWMHSAGGKEPRPSHVRANGGKYEVAKGMKIDGEWIRPGVLINCRCVSRAVVPGFE